MSITIEDIQNWLTKLKLSPDEKIITEILVACKDNCASKEELDDTYEFVESLAWNNSSKSFKYF